MKLENLEEKNLHLFEMNFSELPSTKSLSNIAKDTHWNHCAKLIVLGDYFLNQPDTSNCIEILKQRYLANEEIRTEENVKLMAKLTKISEKLMRGQDLQFSLTICLQSFLTMKPFLKYLPDDTDKAIVLLSNFIKETKISNFDHLSQFAELFCETEKQDLFEQTIKEAISTFSIKKIELPFINEETIQSSLKNYEKDDFKPAELEDCLKDFDLLLAEKDIFIGTQIGMTALLIQMISFLYQAICRCKKTDSRVIEKLDGLLNLLFRTQSPYVSKHFEHLCCFEKIILSEKPNKTSIREAFLLHLLEGERGTPLVASPEINYRIKKISDFIDEEVKEYCKEHHI